MLELKRAIVITVNSSVTYSDEQMETILNALEQEWRNLSDYVAYKSLAEDEWAYDLVMDTLCLVKMYDSSCGCYEKEKQWVDMADLPDELVMDTVRILFDKLCERIGEERLW